MPISDSAKTKLITVLQSANVIKLIDDDYYVEWDNDGNEVYHEAKEFARVQFENSIELQKLALKNFKSEFINNKYIKGFNTILYTTDIKNQCNAISGLLKELQINGNQLVFRTDTVFKHFIIGEEETILDDYGKPTHIPKPRIIEIQLNTLTTHFIKSISSYYNFQKSLIAEILRYIDSEAIPDNENSKYGTSYQYNYFKFNLQQLGVDANDNEYIQDFFNELIDKKFVAEDSLKALLAFFNDRYSKTKVVWLRSKSDLWYFIKQMILKKFLFHPKRETASIISKIFVSYNGKPFTKKDFKGLHDPKNTREIDDVLGILG